MRSREEGNDEEEDRTTMSESCRKDHMSLKYEGCYAFPVDIANERFRNAL